MPVWIWSLAVVVACIALARWASAYTRAVPDWIWSLAIVVAYVALTRWVLPRFGVKT